MSDRDLMNQWSWASDREIEERRQLDLGMIQKMQSQVIDLERVCSLRLNPSQPAPPTSKLPSPEMTG